MTAARNKAQMEGLLSVFPVARTEANSRNELPVLSDTDQAALTYLSKEFEIDFLCLSFTEHARDLQRAREFLSSLGLGNTKVGALTKTYYCSTYSLMNLSHEFLAAEERSHSKSACENND